MNLYECKEASQPYWVHWYQAGWWRFWIIKRFNLLNNVLWSHTAGNYDEFYDASMILQSPFGSGVSIQEQNSLCYNSLQ